MVKNNKHFIHQFLIFGLIGGVGLFVNLGLYNILVATVLVGHEMIANILAVCLTILFNWVLNRIFTFKTTEKKAHIEALQFFISSAIALPLNIFCLYITRDVFDFKSALAANVSIIVATALGMVLKFILYKFWVFKTSKV